MPPFPDVGLARRRVSFSAGNDETVVATPVQSNQAVTEFFSEATALHRASYLIRPKVHFADDNGAAFSGHFNQWALHLGKISLLPHTLLVSRKVPVEPWPVLAPAQGTLQL